MTGGFKKFHIILSAAAWLTIAASVIYLIIIWKTIPDEIIVRFGEGGVYDVSGSKMNILYPCGFGAGVVLLLQLSDFVSLHIRSGMNISEPGEQQFRMALMIFIDVVKICMALYFAFWAYCTMIQIPVKLIVPLTAVGLIAAALIAFLVAAVVIIVNNPADSEPA